MHDIISTNERSIENLAIILRIHQRTKKIAGMALRPGF